MNDTPVSAPTGHPAAAEPVHGHDDAYDDALDAEFGPDAPDPVARRELGAALDGALIGLSAVGIGLGVALVPVAIAVLAEAFTGGFTDPGDILRTAGQVWLAAQRVGLDVTDATSAEAVRLGIVPLGVTIPLAIVLIRAGRKCVTATARRAEAEQGARLAPHAPLAPQGATGPGRGPGARDSGGWAPAKPDDRPGSDAASAPGGQAGSVAWGASTGGWRANPETHADSGVPTEGRGAAEWSPEAPGGRVGSGATGAEGRPSGSNAIGAEGSGGIGAHGRRVGSDEGAATGAGVPAQSTSSDAFVASGESVARGMGVQVGIALAACAVVYAGLAYLVAAVSATPALQPVRERAPVAAAAAVLVFGMFGAVRAGGYRDLLELLPPHWADRLRPFAAPGRAALRAGAAAALLLVIGGAVIVVASLIGHAGEVGALVDRVAVGAPDTIALALLCAALMPNAIMCAVAYASCAGFMVGVGTTVAPTGVTLGAVPALPLLGALPDSASRPGWATLAVPAVAALGAGLIAARATPPGRVWTAIGTAAAAAPVAGLLTAAAAWMSTGAAGSHRLTRVGPHIWTTAGAITAQIAVLATTTAALAAWHHWRKTRNASQLTTVVVTVPEQTR